jgi:hypothetical protein
MSRKTSGKTLKRHAMNIMGAVNRLYLEVRKFEPKGMEIREGGVLAWDNLYRNGAVRRINEESFSWEKIAEEVNRGM